MKQNNLNAVDWICNDLRVFSIFEQFSPIVPIVSQKHCSSAADVTIAWVERNTEALRGNTQYCGYIFKFHLNHSCSVQNANGVVKIHFNIANNNYNRTGLCLMKFKVILCWAYILCCINVTLIFFYVQNYWKCGERFHNIPSEWEFTSYLRRIIFEEHKQS